ncbi:hypothetical protein E3Q08_01667 [Wallemia mellicola]|uniref:Pentacotripeptide-repeat region of PRORP domain-containing protein n=1 Tax=Wallemia mellicola TaxID=1708541 RepID=A0AB38MY45_9BASI|nr:hypothetical protein E3Q21_01339 [Wallemia mellicola]TIB90327.1 hypothetical protein E3Q20_01326 [Wallemia mellicola]TIC06297.1 hypothetical protein E3Q16_01285 [Wallemia mellicola]TIC24561.1 hypothetical protein E3Q12_01427 [Wallemia mellicola]TIC42190.1 hypothetical protein E3Q07_01198 [Wallemia mellicola]
MSWNADKTHSATKFVLSSSGLLDNVPPTICLTTPLWRSIHGLKIDVFIVFLQRRTDEMLGLFRQTVVLSTKRIPRRAPRKPTYDGTGKLQSTDSYLLAARVKELSQKKKFNEAYTVVQNESRGNGLANVVVWNQLLQESRMNQKPSDTYKLFMEMKKRGITPNSRSYTIVFRALSGVDKERPTKKVIEAAETIFRQFGIYQQSLDDEIDRNLVEEERSVLPINAYLSILSKVAHSKDMMDVFEDMADIGPSSADTYTYTTLFQGLLKAGQREDVERGLTLWKVYMDRLKDAWKHSKDTPECQRLLPDTALISTVLRLLSKGTPKDCKTGLMIAHIFLGVPSHSPFIEKKELNIPKVELNDRIIDSLYHLGLAAERPSLVIRHADFLLAMDSVKKYISTRSMFFALLACAQEGNSDKAIEYLHMMCTELRRAQPDSQSFDQAMSAAMKARSYKHAKEIYEMAISTKTEVDIRIMSSFIKAALSTGNTGHIFDAMEIFSKYGITRFIKSEDKEQSRTTNKHQRFWEHRLATGLRDALDKLKTQNVPGRTRKHDLLFGEYARVIAGIIGEKKVVNSRNTYDEWDIDL